jgi:DNA-binding NarL/FixJ family response regulator
MGIVFLSAYMDRGPEVIRLFMDGHDRIVYLLKGSKPKELLDSIHKVSKGLSALEIAIGVQTTHKTAFDLALQRLTTEETMYVTTALNHLADLSEPEWRVFESVGSCRSRQHAARELDLGASTISTHMDTIYDKLHLRDKNASLNQLMLLAKIHLLHHLRQTEVDSET